MYKTPKIILYVVLLVITLTVTICALDGQKTIEDYYDQGLLNPTQITAPNGTVVPAWTAVSDFQDPAKEASKATYDELYASEIAAGLVIYKSEATIAYNCHSYAWHNQDIDSNIIWIDSSNVSVYINDYSYVECTKEELNSINGTIIVVYYNGSSISHSGILHPVTISNPTYEQLTVTSKWGHDGLYTHRLDICPYYNENVTIKFYTRHMYRNCTLIDEYSHYGYCLCGDYKLEAHTYNTQHESYDSDYHYVYCRCDVEMLYPQFEEHSYTISQEGENDSSHVIECVCGEMIWQSHSFTLNLSLYNDTYHKAYCDCNRSSLQYHSYTASYERYNATHHTATCACGASQNMPHIFLVANPNFASQCRFCGQLSNALSAGELATLMANGSIEYTGNGSYRLPSGVIYLMPEDLDAYLDGTLTFRSNNNNLTH